MPNITFPSPAVFSLTEATSNFGVVGAGRRRLRAHQIGECARQQRQVAQSPMARRISISCSDSISARDEFHVLVEQAFSLQPPFLVRRWPLDVIDHEHLDWSRASASSFRPSCSWSAVKIDGPFGSISTPFMRNGWSAGVPGCTLQHAIRRPPQIQSYLPVKPGRSMTMRCTVGDKSAGQCRQCDIRLPPFRRTPSDVPHCGRSPGFGGVGGGRPFRRAAANAAQSTVDTFSPVPS